MSQPLDISSADEGKGVFSEKQIESTDGKMVENEVVFATQHGQALTKSRFDELSIPRTLWLFRRSIFFCLCVYTGYVCEGFELGAGGSVVANAGFIKQFATVADQKGVRGLSTTWLSTWSALLNVGQMVCQTHISLVADRYGRKMSFIYAWVILMLGCTMMNIAKTPQVWALGKLFNGWGIGILQITCQVYVMEIVPNRIRGIAIIWQAVWSNIGGIIVSLMMQQLNQKDPDNYLIAMRILFAPIGLMLLFFLVVPESPWFHARRGQRDKAMKCLHRLYDGVPDYDFEEEIGIIERTIEHEKAFLEHAPRYRDVLTGLNLRRTLTVVILAVCQQLAGLTIISTYSTYFFALSGLSDPFLDSLILSCVNLISIILWALFTDRIGRRLIVCVLETLVVVVCFIVGGLYYTGASLGNAKAATGLLFICCVWTFGFQPIGMSYYLYSAELPSAVLRIKTGPLTFFTNSVFGIASCYATPPLLVHLSLKAGFVYGSLSVPMCILMWRYIPETKGRSASEIDELFENHVPAWKWHNTVTEAEVQMKAAVAERRAKGQQA